MHSERLPRFDFGLSATLDSERLPRLNSRCPARLLLCNACCAGLTPMGCGDDMGHGDCNDTGGAIGCDDAMGCCGPLACGDSRSGGAAMGCCDIMCCAES